MQPARCKSRQPRNLPSAEACRKLQPTHLHQPASGIASWRSAASRRRAQPAHLLRWRLLWPHPHISHGNLLGRIVFAVRRARPAPPRLWRLIIFLCSSLSVSLQRTVNCVAFFVRMRHAGGCRQFGHRQFGRLTRRSGFPAMLAVFQHKSQLSVSGEFRNDP